MQTIPPILAMVIGNNKYSSDKYGDLSGAVADADHFEAYLRGLFKLDAGIIDIISLRNASRQDILNGFLSLWNNYSKWKDNAAIVVFYAGHGARTEKPKEWVDWDTSTGEVEMLCPSDIGVFVGQIVVEGIYDRTISALLNQLSEAMGTNITLIMDCCCSGGITRGDKDTNDYVIREIVDPPPASPKSDQDIWTPDTRGGGAGSGFSGRLHESHVLLAACGREENAYEDPKTNRGYFTTHLLDVLENVDIRCLTYTSLMHKLNLATKLQTPRCEGHGVTWRLFNNQVSGAGWSFILCRRDNQNVITLEAGTAQGITVGSRLSVHTTNLAESRSEGQLEVTSIEVFSSILQVPPAQPQLSLPDLFYCKLVHAAGSTIKLYCRKRHWLESTFPSPLRDEQGIALVDDVSSCDLELIIAHRRVSFHRHHKLVIPHLDKRIRHGVDVEDIDTIRNVVCSSRTFYYHLTRPGIGESTPARLQLKELDCAVSSKATPSEEPILVPTGMNLLNNDPATIVVDEEAVYGMTIINQSDHRLYPFVFYFDPTNLTIEEWYPPPFDLAGASSSSGNVKQTVHILQPRSSLAIGYGASGVWPWGFSLQEDDCVLKRDLGFFRVFLSTRPVPSFFSMKQETPFPLSEARTGRKHESSHLLVDDGIGSAGLCTAQLVTVVLVDHIEKPHRKFKIRFPCF